MVPYRNSSRPQSRCWRAEKVTRRWSRRPDALANRPTATRSVRKWQGGTFSPCWGTDRHGKGRRCPWLCCWGCRVSARLLLAVLISCEAFESTLAWRHWHCSCPWQGWGQCPCYSPGPEPSPKEQERLQCLFLNPRPQLKGHQQQHSYSQAGPRGASLLHGTTQAAWKSQDLAKIVLGSYHDFTRRLHERNRHLSLEKHGLHGQPETPKLGWILGKINSGKKL